MVDSQEDRFASLDLLFDNLFAKVESFKRPGGGISLLQPRASTNYWREFHKKNPDPRPLITMVSEDSVLAKIGRFACVPPIWGDLERYPFADKLKERGLISENDLNHLEYLILLQGDEDVKKWLVYLSKLHTLVAETIEFWERLNLLFPSLHRDRLYGYLQQTFEKLLCFDYTYEWGNGISQIVQGDQFPFITATWCINGKYLMEQHLLPFYHTSCPTKKEVDKLFRAFDRNTVIYAQRFGKMRPDLSVGLIDEIIDELWPWPANPSDTSIQWYRGLRKTRRTYTWSLWYDFKQLEPPGLPQYKTPSMAFLECYIPLMRDIISRVFKKYPTYFRIDRELNTITLTPEGFGHSGGEGAKEEEEGDAFDEILSWSERKKSQNNTSSWAYEFIDRRNRMLALGPYEDWTPNLLDDTHRFVLAHEVIDYVLRKARRYDSSLGTYPSGWFNRLKDEFRGDWFKEQTQKSSLYTVRCDPNCKNTMKWLGPKKASVSEWSKFICYKHHRCRDLSYLIPTVECLHESDFQRGGRTYGYHLDGSYRSTYDYKPPGFCLKDNYRRKWKTELQTIFDHGAGSLDEPLNEEGLYGGDDENIEQGTRVDTFSELGPGVVSQYSSKKHQNVTEDKVIELIDRKRAVDHALKDEPPKYRRVYLELQQGALQKDLAQEHKISQSTISRLAGRVRRTSELYREREP